MLILQRKPGESLFIGEDIEISVVSVDSGGRVRLAIEAPKTCPILRTELRGAVTVNREAALDTLPPSELLSFLGDVIGNSES